MQRELQNVESTIRPVGLKQTQLPGSRGDVASIGTRHDRVVTLSKGWIFPTILAPVAGTGRGRFRSLSVFHCGGRATVQNRSLIKIAEAWRTDVDRGEYCAFRKLPHEKRGFAEHFSASRPHLLPLPDDLLVKIAQTQRVAAGTFSARGAFQQDPRAGAPSSPPVIALRG